MGEEGQSRGLRVLEAIDIHVVSEHQGNLRMQNVRRPLSGIIAISTISKNLQARLCPREGVVDVYGRRAKACRAELEAAYDHALVYELHFTR